MMADICDQAQNEMDVWERVNRQRAQQRRGNPNVESLTNCESCGQPIPEPRRQAVPGCTLCVKCAEEAGQ